MIYLSILTAHLGLFCVCLAQHYPVTSKVRTSFGDNFRDSVDFSTLHQRDEGFFPPTKKVIRQITSSVDEMWSELGNERPYWVATKKETESDKNDFNSWVVPQEQIVNSELTNEVEFVPNNSAEVQNQDKPTKWITLAHQRPQVNRHRTRYQERNRKQRRKTKRKNLKNRSGCIGTCRNMVSCMFSGLKVDWDNNDSCQGMMSTCCTSWGRSTKKNGRRKKKQSFFGRSKKSGRSLGLFSPQVHYTDSVIGHDPNDPIFNSIRGSSSPSVLKVLPNDPDVSYYTCGISKTSGRRIMGGLDAGYGQFPWTAHIKIRGPGIDKVCGGTLIDRKWILTAGHCTQYCLTPDCTAEISQADITYKVILGEYDMLNDEVYTPESYLVTYVFRHPEYKNVMRYRSNGVIESEPRFDVALMLLERPVRPAPNVAPICLPQDTLEPPLPGSWATVVGWGRLGREEGAPHSNVLQATTVPLLSDTGCAIQTGLGLYSDQICAGTSYADSSACPGDSGGGLQIQDDHDRWTLIGIVSNGPSVCGAQPVIFHKIAHTLAWVRQTMHDWTYYSSHESPSP